jgi:hypothetical protein
MPEKKEKKEKITMGKYFHYSFTTLKLPQSLLQTGCRFSTACTMMVREVRHCSWMDFEQPVI